MHGGLAALLVLGGCLVGLFVDRLVVPLAVQQMQQSAGRVGSGEHSSELTVADEHNTFHSNSHMVLQSVVKEESHLGSGVHAARQWRPSQVPPCGEPPLGTELQTNVEVGKREVEYEIVEAASASQHREGAVALVQQTLSAIPTQTEIKAAEKPVPWESELSSVALLADEAEETASFVHRHLKADPKLKPDDVEVTTEHLNQCLSCENTRKHWLSLHPQRRSNAVHFSPGEEDQLFIDDFAIYSWRGIVRFQLPPDSKKVVLRPDPPEDVRFGCPCSAVLAHSGTTNPLRRTPPTNAVDAATRQQRRTGKPRPQSSRAAVRLWHTSSFAHGDSSHYEYVNGEKKAAPADEHRVLSRHSADGVSGWSKGDVLDIDGNNLLKSFTSSEIDQTKNVFYAGYETRHNSLACLAISEDGIHWSQLHSKRAPKVLSRSKLEMDCGGRRASYLGRAADSYVQPLASEQGKAGRTERVLFRKDFGTPGGWREIRGLQSVELNQLFGDIREATVPTVVERRQHAFYLDRLGKLERYRRQIYSLTLTRQTSQLWLGLMTVIEWPKDSSEQQEPYNGSAHAPRYKRDTTEVYLVSSRDGYSFDLSAVYAHRPLELKGKTQRHWASGFVLPAAQIVTDSYGHRIYFEARRLRHEQRFDAPGVIGMASWPSGRFTGLRCAGIYRLTDFHSRVTHCRRNASRSSSSEQRRLRRNNGNSPWDCELTTKMFYLAEGSLYLNVDTASGELEVVVLSQYGRPVATALVPSQTDDKSFKLAWSPPIYSPWVSKDASAFEEPARVVASLKTLLLAGAPVRLEFRLRGPARIFGFRFENDEASSRKPSRGRSQKLRERHTSYSGEDIALRFMESHKRLSPSNRTLTRVSSKRRSAQIILQDPSLLEGDSSTFAIEGFKDLAPRYFDVVDPFPGQVHSTWSHDHRAFQHKNNPLRTDYEKWCKGQVDCRSSILFISRYRRRPYIGSEFVGYGSKVYSHRFVSDDALAVLEADRPTIRPWKESLIEPRGHLTGGVPHNLGVLMVLGSRGEMTLFGVGGQADHTSEIGDGIYLFEARGIHDLLHGWLPPRIANVSPQAPRSGSLLVSGNHAGCVEVRARGAVCAFNGKLSLAQLRSRYFLFVRANILVSGGRHVQVAISSMDGPRSPYSPFQLIQVLGYEHGAAGGIYEATVKANPIDPDSTLLGLFAVSLGKPGEVNGDGTAFVALSISCNGVVWSPFIIISTTQVSKELARRGAINYRVVPVLKRRTMAARMIFRLMGLSCVTVAFTFTFTRMFLGCLGNGIRKAVCSNLRFKLSFASRFLSHTGITTASDDISLPFESTTLSMNFNERFEGGTTLYHPVSMQGIVRIELSSIESVVGS